MSSFYNFSRLLVLILLLAACGAAAPSTGSIQEADEGHELIRAPTELPRYTPVALADDEKLLVVVTTNLIADVVAQVGGEHIELYAMLPSGADPHSYQPTPQDLRMLTDADVVFINGLGLEEAMALALEDYAAKSVVVNTGVETIEFGTQAHDEDAHEGIDPHTWFSPHAVEIWTHNIAKVLSDLDPGNASAYSEAAAVYDAQLEALHDQLTAQVARIPVEQRKLVTDHDSLGYLAAEYGFEIVGSVIPSASTLAEPSAQELAALQDEIAAEGVKAIFVGASVNQQLETQLGADLGVAVVSIHTGSLSEADGPAATYLDFMHYNMGVIVEALQ